MNRNFVLRAIGTIGAALLGWQIGSLLGGQQSQPRNAVLGIAIGAIVGLVLSPFIIVRPYVWFRSMVGRMPAGDLVSSMIGLVLGLIIAALLAYPLSFLPWWFGHVLPAVFAVVCAYAGISIMMMRRRELLRFLPMDQPQGGDEEQKQPNGHVLIDTSAIIDGRIADISQTGFLHGTIVVPRFVLKELQHIADSPDALRRNRGRRGLEMLNRLQKDTSIDVDISDIDARDVHDVDGKLVTIARKTGTPIVTNDFNLNRVASLEGVRVLNVNQLANALKAVVLPGEEMAVHVIQEGKEAQQGVGYLDDGTMIVVEMGRRYMNREITVTVTRVLQTVAGRMIFAVPKGEGRE